MSAPQAENPLTSAFYAAREAELQKRVGEKRFLHSQAVAETAAELARVYGVDAERARLAGLLHDWDKGYDNPGILARVEELELQLDAELLSLPRLIHGLTAAAALARDFPHIPADVLQAVRWHTIGNPHMAPLDMVVYVADAIEPHRKGQRADALRALVGKVDLRELYIETYAALVSQMLDARKNIYSKTVDTWNAYMQPEGDFTPGFAADVMPQNTVFDTIE